MAFQGTHTVGPIDLAHRFVASVRWVPSAIWNGLIAMSSSDQRLKQAEKLQAKSDAELAEMGLERSEIVRHVFRDVFYL